MNKLKLFNILAIIILLGCSREDTSLGLFLRINSTSPNQFGFTNYLVTDSCIYKNENGFLQNHNSILRIKLENSQKETLVKIKSRIMNMGTESYDSSLYHPNFYMEFFEEGKFDSAKTIVFSNTLPHEFEALLKFFQDSVNWNDGLELSGPFDGSLDLNLVASYKREKRTRLSSYKSFNNWLQLILFPLKEIKKIEIEKMHEEIEFLYPIDYEKSKVKKIYKSNSGKGFVLINEEGEYLFSGH